MNIIDTRDLINRLEELRETSDRIDEISEEIAELEEEANEGRVNDDVVDDIISVINELGAERGDLVDNFSMEDEDELKELLVMEEEVSEWQHGTALIDEDYWVEYVEEMLVDIGDLPSDIPWYIAIDWETTANNISMDYSEVEYMGCTYLYRS